MILQQLYRDASAILGDMPPSMYRQREAHWAIQLTINGALVGGGFLSLRTGKRGTSRLLPDVGRSGLVIRPVIAADSPAFVLGIGEDRRTDEKHAAFRALVEQCAQETGLKH